MRGCGFFFLFLVTWAAAFVYLGYYTKEGTSSNPGIASISNGNEMQLPVRSRKLKEDIDPSTSEEDDAGHIHLDDYRPIDPVPSSKASIRPGPIQHGTPLMPYIPKPSPPPSQLKHNGILN